MINRIESIINWFFDRDFTLWLLGRFRPGKNEPFSWKRVCLLISLDIVLALLTFYACFYIFYKLNPVLFAILLALLSEDLGEQPLLTLSCLAVVMILPARLLMAFAWNRRARRGPAGLGGNERI